MGLWGIIPLMEVRDEWDEFSGTVVGWGGDRRYRHSGQR